MSPGPAPLRLRPPWITLALCVGCTLVTGWGMLSAGQTALGAGALVALGAKAPGLVWDLGEGWRLLAAHLAHRDLVHLGGNLFLLGHLGARLERGLGRGPFAATCLAAALGCGLASVVCAPGVGCGASGIVFGLLGAALVEGPSAAVALAGLAAAAAAGGAIDHFGHLGGLFGGAGYTVLRLALGERRAQAVGALGLAAAVAVGAQGTRWEPRQVGRVLVAVPPGGVVRDCGEGCTLFESKAGADGLRLAVIDPVTGPDVPAGGCDERLCVLLGDAGERQLVAVYPAWAQSRYEERVGRALGEAQALTPSGPAVERPEARGARASLPAPRPLSDLLPP